MAYRESYAGKINRKLNKKLHVVEVASGRQKADLVLKNATYVNVFCNELSHGDIAVAEGLIAGMGEHYEGAVEVDMGGKLVLPGFVDAHIHLESSLVSPKEFANAVVPHGTTTVITDPHEIANVMGTDGIEYMLQATEDLPVDVRFMLPSCVPATPLDESGAVLDYRAIDSFYEHNRVEGLAEMMNSYGVIHNDPEVVNIGSGSDIAIESADIVLMRSDLEDVPRALRLSALTLRDIKQNLFWAFCYNTVGIPIAAGLLYAFGGPLLSPMFAGAAMSLSSVCVVGNALRLGTVKL